MDLAENSISTIEVVISSAEYRFEDRVQLVERVVKSIPKASEPLFLNLDI